MTFHYQSQQVHTTVINGKKSTRSSEVNVKNGKGFKKLTTNGKTKRKPLTKKEMKNIQKGIYMPNLFHDCLRPKCSTRRRRGE